MVKTRCSRKGSIGKHRLFVTHYAREKNGSRHQKRHREERAADAIAVWILTNQFADPPTAPLNCDDTNAEMAWHEAYRDVAVNNTHEREWFPLWWGSEP